MQTSVLAQRKGRQISGEGIFISLEIQIRSQSGTVVDRIIYPQRGPYHNKKPCEYLTLMTKDTLQMC